MSYMDEPELADPGDLMAYTFDRFRFTSELLIPRPDVKVYLGQVATVPPPPRPGQVLDRPSGPDQHQGPAEVLDRPPAGPDLSPGPTHHPGRRPPHGGAVRALPHAARRAALCPQVPETAMTIPNLIPTNLDACQVAIRRDGVKGRVLFYGPTTHPDYCVAVLWGAGPAPVFYTPDGRWVHGPDTPYDLVAVEPATARTDDDRADLYEFLRTCTLSESDELERLWCAVGNELYPGQETSPTPEQFDAVVRETKRRWEARQS